MATWEQVEKLISYRLDQLSEEQAELKKELVDEIKKIKDALDKHITAETNVLINLDKRLSHTSTKTNIMWAGVALILSPLLTFVINKYLGG